MKKWQTGLIYAAMIVVFLIYKNEILQWMQMSQANIVIIFLITFCFVMIPVIPFKVIIGILGFMYGPLWGAFISWTAATTAAIIVFLLVRYYFQQQGRTYFAKYERLKKIQSAIDRNPFQTILLARILPFLPQAVVNIYAAFTSIRLLTYILATALGKIPGMLLYAFIGNTMFSDMRSFLISIAVYAVFLLVTFQVYRLYLKD